MNRNFGAVKIFGCALLASSAATVARAQAGGNPTGLPYSVSVRAPDENGVDMYTGSAAFATADVSLAGLAHSIMSLNPPDHRQSPLSFNRATGLMDNYQAVVVPPQCSSSQCIYSYQVGTGASTDRFLMDNSTGGFQIGAGGSMLISDPASSDPNCIKGATVPCPDWLYIQKDGTTISITKPQQPYSPPIVTKIAHPDGTIDRVIHANTLRTITAPTCPSSNPCVTPYQTGYPVLAVNRSDGTQLKYQYGPNWDLQGVIAINNAYEYCNPNATTCSPAESWPSSSYNWAASSSGPDTVLTVNDSAGLSTRYTLDNFGRVKAVKPPNSSVDMINLTYCLRRFEYDAYATGPRPAGSCFYYLNTYQGGTSIVYVEDRVLSATRESQTWTYGYPVQGSTIYANETSTMLPITSTRPDGKITIANQTVWPSYLIDYSAPGKFATFEQNFANKVISARSWSAGGVSYNYKYDNRANVLSDGIVSAGYETNCQNVRTCNKPIWTRDAKGNQTDYIYDPRHGGILTVTMPADINGVRPQTRYSYVQRYAWFINAGGQMVRSTDPIWKIATQSICQKGAAAAGGGCVIANDEVITAYDYGPDSGPNNLWLRGIVVTSGGISRRTCYNYDRFGNRISTTTPRAGLSSCQ